MGVFNKSLKHFRSSQQIEDRIKNLDEDLQKTKVVIENNDLESVYKSKEQSSSIVSNWREEFIVENNISFIFQGFLKKFTFSFSNFRLRVRNYGFSITFRFGEPVITDR